MKFGIRARLWIAAALPAVLVVAALLQVFLQRYSDDLLAAQRTRALAATHQLAVGAELPLFSNNRAELQRLVEAAKAGDRDVHSAALFDREGHLRALAGNHIPDAPNPIGSQDSVRLGPQLVVSVPVASSLAVDDLFSETALPPPATAGHSNLGYAVIEFDLDRLKEQQQSLMIWALATTFGALLLATLLSSLIASSVVRPIKAISQVVERIGTGALDSRADSANAGVLTSLASGINAMAGRLESAQDELKRQIFMATEELRQQKEAAERMARIDSLTGLLSRRALTEAGENGVKHALRYGNSLSLLMVDIDHFKAINDSYGHATGDAVIVSFAQTLASMVREVDVVGRIGGEEFVVLLPETGFADAMMVAERMRVAVANSGLHALGQKLRYTASFGVAEFNPKEVTFSGLLARADAALYRAKSLGRNRVELASDELYSETLPHDPSFPAGY